MSRVVGVTMVRDEEDVIETTLRHMATQVDALIVADNNSVDATPEIIDDVRRSIPINLLVVRDRVVAYEQSAKMTGLAQLAHHQFDAEWIVPFDADEIWMTMSGHRVADDLERCFENIAQATLYDHVATGIDDPMESDPIRRLPWRRRTAGAMPKVAVRYSDDLVIEMGNHGAHYSRNTLPTWAWGGGLIVHHFPYRSVDQLLRKVRNGAQAYAATDMPEHFGSHWRQWGQILNEHGPQAIEDLFYKWYWRKSPAEPITVDGEPQGPLMFDPAVT